MRSMLAVLLSVIATTSYAAEQRLYALNLYGGVMTTNDWDEIAFPSSVDFKDSYLAAATLARNIGWYKHLASFELEGQVVKHFNFQNHWEINALVTGRWEAFWWDKHLDTSLAFGLGPSYATEKPDVEIYNDGDTSQLLVYWMIELALALPQHAERTALILRIHHRSDAFGLVAEKGGSNALGLGMKIRL
ncbi:hypothetical protein ACFL6U_17550 [Planctomycetota bacterium]